MKVTSWQIENDIENNQESRKPTTWWVDLIGSGVHHLSAQLLVDGQRAPLHESPLKSMYKWVNCQDFGIYRMHTSSILYHEVPSFQVHWECPRDQLLPAEMRLPQTWKIRKKNKTQHVPCWNCQFYGLCPIFSHTYTYIYIYGQSYLVTSQCDLSQTRLILFLFLSPCFIIFDKYWRRWSRPSPGSTSDPKWQHQMRVAMGARRNFVLLGETDASWCDVVRAMVHGCKWVIAPQKKTNIHIYIYITYIYISHIYIYTYISIYAYTSGISLLLGEIWIIKHLLSGMHIQVRSQIPPKLKDRITPQVNFFQ